MDVFISWSGPRSRIVADALRSWLPSVLQAVDPWLSSADIDAGSRWHQELGSRLSTSNFGVICLTPENQSNKWLLYEAGALSKSVESARVVPYLVGLRKADVDGPLSHFQSVEADKDGTFELLRSLNAVLSTGAGRALLEANLARAFEVWWPELDLSLQKARDMSTENTPEVAGRATEDMVLEIVENTRSVSRRLEALIDRLDQAASHRIPQQATRVDPEPEAIEATRQALAALLDRLAVEADRPDMERLVQTWQRIVADPQSSFEALTVALSGAKSMREYFDR
jgi:hypothetical protein